MSNKDKKAPERLIANNKKAGHDYHIEEHLEAGLVLQGWEVKSIRAGRIQLRDSYVVFKNGEAWLIGSHISPLETVSTHITPDAQRTRKLLMTQRELGKLFGAIQREGYTAIPLDMHWHKNRVKVEIGLGKGKKTHDKRETIKRRDWEREKHRVLKGR
jgi:SsrA-binding protein